MTTTWSEIRLIPSLFLTREFFLVCLNPEDQARSLCTNPTETPEQCLLCHPWTAAQTPVWSASSPWDRTGWREPSARRTSEQSWEWPVWAWHTWHTSCWPSNPIWAAAAPESKEQHSIIIKLVLQCQACSYPQRRWSNLTNTACLPPALYSHLFAATPLTPKQQRKELMLAKLRIREVELEQDGSCVAMAFLLRSGHRNSSLGRGRDAVAKKQPEGKEEGLLREPHSSCPSIPPSSSYTNN